MFEVLIESGGGDGRRDGRWEQERHGLASLVAGLSVHALLLVAVGLGWRNGSVTPMKDPVSMPVDIYIETPGASAPAVNGMGARPAIPPLPSPLPNPSIGASAALVPDVSLPIRALYQSGASAQEIAGRSLWGPHPGPTTAFADSVRLAGEVDEPVVVLHAVSPQYPGALASAGIAGTVRLEFTVDTTGLCESSSVRIVESSHPGFEAAAIASVMASSFRAARVGGHPVRQLVYQRISFRLR